MPAVRNNSNKTMMLSKSREWLLSVAAIILLFVADSGIAAGRGILSLDELNFDRVVNGQRKVLVKFDNKWAVSEMFSNLAVEVGKSGVPILCAEVEVEDYEQFDGRAHQWNVGLRDQYNVSELRYPAFRMINEDGDVKKYNGAGSDEEGFRKWLRVKGGIYVGEDAVMQDIDKVACKFMASSVEERRAVLQEARQVATKMGEAGVKQRLVADTYVKIMEMISTKGTVWLHKEVTRIKRLSQSPAIADDKRDEFKRRLAAITTLTGEMDFE